MDWLSDPKLRIDHPDTQTATDDGQLTRPGNAGRRRPLVAIVVLVAVIVAAALLPRLWTSTAPATAPVPAWTSSTDPDPGVPVTVGPATVTPTASDQAEPEYLPAETQQKLLATAEAAMKAFARPGKKVSHRAWFQRLSRYLTGESAEVYEATDPANVPFRRVTGRAVLGPITDEAELTRSVDVATEAGRYRVHISMLDLRVEAFQPLEN